jgi:hypothetical protein
MIQSSRKDRKAKAIAEVLALIDDMEPVYRPEHPPMADGKDEKLWEDATAFGAALEKLFDGHLYRKTGRHARRRCGIWFR